MAEHPTVFMIMISPVLQGKEQTERGIALLTPGPPSVIPPYDSSYTVLPVPPVVPEGDHPGDECVGGPEVEVVVVVVVVKLSDDQMTSFASMMSSLYHFPMTA